MKRIKSPASNLVSDLIAGFTGAIASIPDAMASAVIAGLSPVHGLYAFMFGTPIAALFSSSVLMAVTPTSALALLTKAGLATMPPDQAAGALVLIVFLAGFIQFIFGLLRLGFLTHFVSNAVMTGFLNGVSLLILMGTLPDLMGFQSEARGNLLKFIDLLAHLDRVNPTILTVASATIASLLLFDRWKFSKISPLLALGLASLIAAVDGTGAIPLIGTVYDLPQSLPHIVWPDFTALGEVFFPAFAIAAIGLIQAAGVSQSTPNPSGDYPSISRDFTAQGLGNLASGLLQGLPIGGSLSSTALMRGAGAKSRWANVAVGIIMALVVATLAPLINLIPLSAIDGLLFVFVARSLNFHQLSTVWQTNRFARGVMLFSLAATIALPLEIAVGLSIAASFVLHIFRASHQVRLVRLHFDDQGIIEEPAPRDLPSGEITLLSVYGSLFFAGARTFEQRLPSPERSERPIVILILRGREDVGSTFIGAISRYAHRLNVRRGQLILSGVDEHIMNQLERTRTIDMIGRSNIFPASNRLGEPLRHAIARAKALIIAAPSRPGPAPSGASAHRTRDQETSPT